MDAGGGEVHQVESGIGLSHTFFTMIFRELTSVTGKNCEESIGTQQGNTAELQLEAQSPLPVPHQQYSTMKQPGCKVSNASSLKKVRLRITQETVSALHYSFIQNKQSKGFQMYTFWINAM